MTGMFKNKYITEQKILIIKKWETAVPSIFDFPEHLQVKNGSALRQTAITKKTLF